MRRVLPFDSGDATQVDPSWPLAPGLVFAASLADGQGGNVTPVGGAKNLLTGVGTSSGLIHATNTPFGKGRRRTDGSSNFIWDYRERVDVGTGDFTAAVYGLPTIDSASVLNWFSNDTGANQWRILTDCNSSIAFAAGSLAFWTFDGSTTIVTAAGAMIARPAWYSAVRRGTTLEIWRNGALLASASGTARNVTGTKQGKIMLGSGTTNSRGLFGPALLWRRALTPTEIQSLNPDSPFEFVKSPYRHAIVPAAAGGSATDLASNEASHAHSADALTLTTSAVLTIADSTHAHAAESPAPSSSLGLAVADALHGHAADNLTLDTTGAATLTTQDSTHAHAVDAPMLYTDWLLAVAEATHGHAADNVALSDAPELAPADATHGQVADAITLSVDAWLTIQQATQTQVADKLTLGGVAPEPWPLIKASGPRPRQLSTATRRNVQ